MITLSQYFGAKPHNQEHEDNATYLLRMVDELMHKSGLPRPIDPDTGSEVSGSRGGQGDGGFRLTTSTTGRPGSAHKTGQAVDVYDPVGELDDWITDDILVECGLWREDPDNTPGWCHLQTRSASRRTYTP